MRAIHILFGIQLLLNSCGKKNDDKGPGSSGGDDDGLRYGKITLKSSSLTNLTDSPTPEDCAHQLDIYRLEGICLTPVNFSGHAMAVYGVSEVAGLGAARLMALEEEEGEGEIFPGATFNFDATGGSLVGNNTLFSIYDSKPLFKGVSVDMAYRSMKISIKDKFVTILIPAYSQPFATAAEELCGIDSNTSSQPRYSDADLLEGMTFSRGDFLFCVKDSASDTCAASDYKWLDTAANTLVSTRPSVPKKSTYLSGEAMVCQQEGDRIGFNPKFPPVYANLTSSSYFKLYADFSHGSMSQQYGSASHPFGDESLSPEGGISPYLYYTYEPQSGTTSNGTNLKIDFDFDFTRSLVIESFRVSDISSTTLEALLENIHEASLWVHDKKYQGGVDGGFASHYAVMQVTPTVSLSGEKSPPSSKDSL